MPHHIWVLSLLAALLICEPVLANKFETIGGGVSGSFRIKREFLQTALLVGGAILAICSLLVVLIPHTNPSYLNYANWKTSAVVLAALSAIMFTSYFFV